MGGIFTLGECAAKDLREQDDAFNAAIGGCAAGMLAGIKSEFFFGIEKSIEQEANY
jgi:hypothetical protein